MPEEPQKVFRSTCKECVAAGVDPALVTFEHEDADQHAKEFHAHVTAGVHGDQYIKQQKKSKKDK